MPKAITRTLDTPKVVVFVHFGSNTVVLDENLDEVSRPTFMAGIEASILAARQYFWDNCDGRTFTALPAIRYDDPREMATIFSEDGGTLSSVVTANLCTAHTRKEINLASPWRLNCYTTPMPFTDGSFIGLTTQASYLNIDVRYTGPTVSHDWPGFMFVGSDFYGKLLGGVKTDPGDSLNSGRGVFAHELAHGFGGETFPISAALPHDAGADDPRHAWPNLMNGGSYPSTGFTPYQKHRVLRSPFLTPHAVRPS